MEVNEWVGASGLGGHSVVHFECRLALSLEVGHNSRNYSNLNIIHVEFTYFPCLII